MSDCIGTECKADTMLARIARLTAALEWYADESRACNKNSHSGKHHAAEALLASVSVLALDGGRRADIALGRITNSLDDADLSHL